MQCPIWWIGVAGDNDFWSLRLLHVFPEQKKKESDDIDHDAIAHRLKQDVVSIIVLCS